MNVRDIMSPTVDSIDARTTISNATRRITDDDIGARPEDDVATVLALMSRQQVRRMTVREPSREVVGIIGLADAAQHAPDRTDVTTTLAEICEPHGQHCQAPVA